MKHLIWKQSKQDSTFLSQQAKGESKGYSKGPGALSNDAPFKGNNNNNKNCNKVECTFCGHSGHLNEQFFAWWQASMQANNEVLSKFNLKILFINFQNQQQQG